MTLRIMRCRYLESVYVQLARVVVALSLATRRRCFIRKHSNLSLRHLCTTLEAECLQSCRIPLFLCFPNLPLHSLVVRFHLRITLACIQSCLQPTLYCRVGPHGLIWAMRRVPQNGVHNFRQRVGGSHSRLQLSCGTSRLNFSLVEHVDIYRRSLLLPHISSKPSTLFL